MSYKDVKQWRENTKAKLVVGFGGCCGLCGLADVPSVFDFHHLTPDQKEFTIGNGIKAWERVVAEVTKCVMLCSNCHRKVHADVVSLLTDRMPRFVEPVSDDAHLYDSCPVCGSRKRTDLRTCSRTCAGKVRHRIDWDSINLRALYETEGSVLAMSRVLGVSDVAIKKQMVKRGIC